MHVEQALYQLSYIPSPFSFKALSEYGAGGGRGCALCDLEQNKPR